MRVVQEQKTIDTSGTSLTLWNSEELIEDRLVMAEDLSQSKDGRSLCAKRAPPLWNRSTLIAELISMI